MIPVSLNLKNFLSYGDQVPTLDFTSLHVVCLSGDNGHGKSALLDAITWAVWGEARKASGDRKPDERLLRMGTTDMAVEFVFELEGDRYRILRQYRSGRGGKSMLEFQVYSEETEGYIPLTQPSITATQTKIIEALRMDYKTFINSVFILQGRADEFTKRSARERKEILADILGLWRYDELRDRARLHMQRAEQDREECDRRIQEIDTALEDKDACKQMIVSLESTIKELESQKTEIEVTLNKHQVRQAEVGHARLQLTELQTRYTDLEQDHNSLSAQLSGLQEKVDGYRTALSERKRIEKASQDYQSLTAEYEQLNKKAQTDRLYEQRKIEAERVIEAERHEIEKQRQVYDARQESVERTVEETMAVLAKREQIEKGYRDLLAARESDEQWEDRRRQHEETDRKLRSTQDKFNQISTTLQSELGGYRLRLNDLNGKSEKVARFQKEATEHREQLESLRKLELEQKNIEDQGRELNSQIEILKNKIKLYEHEDSDVDTRLNMLRRGASTNCPLCDAALDDHRRESIEVNLGEKIKKHAEEIHRHQGGIKQYQDQRNDLALKFKKNRPRLEALSGIQQALAAAEAGVREASDAANETLSLKKQIKSLEDRLTNGGFAPELQQDIVSLNRQITEINYSSDQHDAVKSSLRDLQSFESDKSRLDDAFARYKKATASLPPIQEKLHLFDRRLQEKTYAADSHQTLSSVLDDIRQLGYDETRHKAVEKKLSSLKNITEEKNQLDQAIRQFDTAQEALNERKERAVKLKDEMKKMNDRIKSLAAGARETEQVEQEIQKLRDRHGVLQREQDDANRQLGGEQQRAVRFEKLSAERPEIKEKRDRASQDVQIYEKLATAFGKDGIQALIIENAIPEIEDEANRILSRLTGNKTQITIEPLRNLKTGGTRETLDIHISDEMGTRPYEMYSGGEAFRTNFALRIALSKLLAQRAGTRLRTLVIDEGFGTQDVEGLEYLIEALQGIQEDFEKIIVVTHLERLKGAFPARIEVVKHPDTGSLFEVFE